MVANVSGQTADERTLAGRRVVITRAPEQNEELARELAAQGAEVLRLPLVHFAPARDTSGVDAAIAALGEFDWLVFTSGNAVRFFLARCRERGCWPSASELRIAAVGPATRDALEGEGLRVARMPREFGGAGVAGELRDDVAGRRVLLPRSDRASDELPAALRAAGAAVTEVVAYRTAEPESLDGDVIAALRRGEADAVTFFSPSAFQHFARALGAGALSEMGAAGVVFAALGPTTAAAIRAADVAVMVEAPEATSAALVSALGRHFAAPAAGKGRPR